MVLCYHVETSGKFIRRTLIIDLEGFLVKYSETVVGIHLVKARNGGKRR